MTGGLAEARTEFPDGGEFLLLPPTAQAHAYAHVDRMFATRTIRRGGTVLDVPRGPEIAPTYVRDGETRGVADYLRRAHVAGLLVISDGQIVLERYGLGLTESTRWSTMSTVKSMTSTLVGAALQDGAIGSLDDVVSDYLPALRGSAYDAVAIRHLTTMSSGVGWNEDYTDRASDVNRYSRSLGSKTPEGVMALMRSMPAANPPGRCFNYNSGDTYLLGRLVSAATGQRLADYMSDRIWARLGMEFDAYYTLESEGGPEIGGSRAGIALRDFGRFGMLILQDGIVAGEPILRPGWVDEAGRAVFPLAPEENAYGAVGYGHSWWIDPDGAMVAVGFAGQSLYIHREKRLVIVTLSCQPQPPYAAAYATDPTAERRAFQGAVGADVQVGR